MNNAQTRFEEEKTALIANLEEILAAVKATQFDAKQGWSNSAEMSRINEEIEEPLKRFRRRANAI